MRATRITLALASAVVLLTAATAYAVVAVRLPLDDIVRDSTVIVRGKVQTSESFMDEELGRVFTRHTVAVAEYLKGSGKLEVTVVTMGGELENIGQLVPGETRFDKGEEVVVCLRPGRQHHVVVGMSQGKFRVVKRDKKLFLQRNLSGVKLVGEPQDRPKKPEEEVPMDTFRKLVEGLAK